MTEDPELADGLADRALGRTMTALAVGSLALAVMALLFVLLADGTLDERSLPQVLVLGAGWLVGTVAAVAISALLRRLRADVDSGRRGLGPGVAAVALRWVDRVVVGIPVLAGVVAVASVVVLRPVATAMLSAAVGVAVVSQLAVLAAAQRPALRRAAALR